MKDTGFAVSIKVTKEKEEKVVLVKNNLINKERRLKL